MPKKTAGILLYRRAQRGLELLLVHPGGPLWAGKEDAAWGIPKGEFEAPEEPLAAAKREFCEETGGTVVGEPFALSTLRPSGGKVLHAFALEGDFDPQQLRSNLFAMEWPPRSGASREFPEIDRAAWFTPEEARRKLHRGQVPLVDLLLAALARP